MKVGYINYCNSFPFYHEAIESPIADIEIHSHPPSQLNLMLHKGQLDVSAISTFEYLSHSDQYVILPDLSINSQGYVKSVLLFSQVPLEELNHQEIFLSTESATSTHLLKILLQQNNISIKNYLDYSESILNNEAKAIMLIGDAALNFKSTDHPYVYDLAHEWNCLFDLPLVFALWVVRKEIANKYSDTIYKLHQQLVGVRENLSVNLEELAPIISQHFKNLNVDINEYFSHLNFELRDECIESIYLYADKLYNMNILKNKTQLEFLSF
ncbi:MAG: menaquinone biosynthesis protein [Planctomycetes bacterium]|nr:menaquinone biosynthesis protein [Planctomycetota bacterium]